MPREIFAHIGSLLAVGITLSAATSRIAYAGRDLVPSCWSEGPVLDINSEWHPASGSNAEAWMLGAFQLPLAPWRPDIKTEARLSWLAFQSDPIKINSERVQVRLTFPDPKPFGLPYTVQGFAIDAREGSFVQDWTHHCEDPGISVFPGQTWSEDLEVPDGNSGFFGPNETVRVRIWGSRN